MCPPLPQKNRYSQKGNAQNQQNFGTKTFADELGPLSPVKVDAHMCYAI